MADPNVPKIEADAIFHATMTCLPAITQAYRLFRAQGKTEEDFDRCAREAMTKAVRNAVELTAREVKDPVWPYALEPAPGAPAVGPRCTACQDAGYLLRWGTGKREPCTACTDGMPASIAKCDKCADPSWCVGDACKRGFAAHADGVKETDRG